MPSFETPIKKVYLLSNPNRENLAIERVNGVRVIRTPRNLPNAMANVIVVEIDGATINI